VPKRLMVVRLRLARFGRKVGGLMSFNGPHTCLMIDFTAENADV
jgi:hypothetical protein